MAKDQDSAERFLPPERDIASLRAAAEGCTACKLHLTGTQTVFGTGDPHAVVMLVGEQPGDAEDRAGTPFVGPAGKLLDKAMEMAGIERRRAYLTNVVKHFKWEPRGRKRLHAKPTVREARACGPWLEAEIASVRPKVIVCLGATAAQALLGGDFKVTERRGSFIQSAHAPYTTATVHPSSLLRISDRDRRHAEMDRFVADLRKVAEMMQD